MGPNSQAGAPWATRLHTLLPGRDESHLPGFPSPGLEAQLFRLEYQAAGKEWLGGVPVLVTHWWPWGDLGPSVGGHSLVEGRHAGLGALPTVSMSRNSAGGQGFHRGRGMGRASQAGSPVPGRAAAEQREADGGFE